MWARLRAWKDASTNWLALAFSPSCVEVVEDCQTLKGVWQRLQAAHTSHELILKLEFEIADFKESGRTPRWLVTHLRLEDDMLVLNRQLPALIECLEGMQAREEQEITNANQNAKRGLPADS